MQKERLKENANHVGALSVRNTREKDPIAPIQKNNGITLIALIITIIVMLILVGVTVSIALKGELFKTAKDAAKRTEAERDNEIELSSGEVIDKWVNGVKIKDLEPDKVYYADINKDGTPDGVIYADLTRGNVKSGEWGDSWGFYTIPNDLTNPKEYTVSVENYNGPLAKFGAGDVLTVSGNESGNDRFYMKILVKTDHFMTGIMQHMKS